MDHPARLSMPMGEAMFTQRSIRRFKPDPLPVEDIHLIMEAAVKAPNGANKQIARFLVITDRARLREFGALYHEAWWAKRREEYGWTKPEDIPVEEKSYRSAMGLADRIKDVPCVVFAFGIPSYCRRRAQANLRKTPFPANNLAPFKGQFASFTRLFSPFRGNPYVFHQLTVEYLSVFDGRGLFGG